MKLSSQLQTLEADIAAISSQGSHSTEHASRHNVLYFAIYFLPRCCDDCRSQMQALSLPQLWSQVLEQISNARACRKGCFQFKGSIFISEMRRINICSCIGACWSFFPQGWSTAMRLHWGFKWREYSATRDEWWVRQETSHLFKF